MNTRKGNEDGDALDKVLAQWTEDAPLPSRFQEQVWQRIAKAAPRSGSTVSAGFRRLLEVVLPRPKFAFAYLSVLLAMGVAAGSVTAQIKSRRMTSELGMLYLQSIDPFQSESPHP